MDRTTAIHIIAMHLLARTAENPSEDEWENYPEIGENDWERVVDEARRIRPSYPNKADYDAAYALLNATQNPDTVVSEDK